GPKKAAIGRSCGVGGVGGQRHFGKSGWIGSGRGGRGRTRAPKSGNRKNKRRNGSSAECWGRQAGRRGNWKSGQRGHGEGANRGKTERGNHDDLGMDCETAAHGPLENGVQRNARRFETEKNANTTLVTSDPGD